MELLEVIQEVALRTQEASQPTQFQIGKVTATNPLKLSIHPAMPEIEQSMLYLTEGVVEKKIPIVTHSHTISDTYTGGGSCSTELSHIICQEHGQELPIEDGYLILNRGLQVGDKVLLLQVEGGQRFLILSRLYE